MTLGLGTPEIYGYHQKQVLTAQFDNRRFLLCTLNAVGESAIVKEQSKLSQESIIQYESGGSYEVNMATLTMGLMQVGAFKFTLLNSGSNCAIALNQLVDRVVVCLGGDILILAVSWEIINSSKKKVPFREVISHDFNEEDSPCGHIKVHFSILKRFQKDVSVLCVIESGKYLLVSSESGIAHKLSWEGEILLSWQQSGVHSVYRTSQPIVCQMTQISCWGAQPQPPKFENVLEADGETENAGDEQSWEQNVIIQDDSTEPLSQQQRNGSIIR